MRNNVGGRFLRLILMFDLPVETSKNRRDYRAFIKYLKTHGYLRLQYSVYSKLVMNRNVLKYHEAKLMANVPPNGKVQTLVVTENQFADMKYLVGEPSEDERVLTSDRVVEL